MKILVKGEVETVSLDRVKPAHSASLQQVRQYSVKRQTNQRDRRLPGHLVGIHRVHLDLVVRTLRRPTGRALKRKSRRQSEAVKKSATVPKQLDVKVNLSNRDNTYVAPHSRAPAVSRAIGNGGGLQTYSRIPLHLRGKTPGAADAVIDSTKSNHANIANREKISTDQTVRKTRVGRIIQTPARFLQMVHAIVAPNDIYGGPNRMHRIHNVFEL